MYCYFFISQINFCFIPVFFKWPTMIKIKKNSTFSSAFSFYIVTYKNLFYLLHYFANKSYIIYFFFFSIII